MIRTHQRWGRSVESDAFFLDEDGLRWRFRILASLTALVLAALASGVLRLEREAASPPPVFGVFGGLVFGGRPGGLESVSPADFERQFTDTVEVLFSRTEKGVPPEISQFCAPEVAASVAQAYGGSAARYPGGYAQTLVIQETRTLESRRGSRRIACRGLLSSRSLAAAQTSPVYLDCAFAVGTPTELNATGWRLVRVDAIGRDDFYRAEREQRLHRALGLAATP
jgi:hypothetical protein